MNYHCKNCECDFMRPAIAEECYGNEGPWYQRFEICPYCRVAGMMEVAEDAGIAY
ncbi:MAG: hypothetical protein IJN34_00830 [Clostridia bacterium]|nr:hypothetical protein [Clostridia bacterium]